MQTDSASRKFPKKCILNQSIEFQAIFQTGKKIRTKYATLYFKLNELGHSRLGLVVAKKNFRLAVKRNLLKRIIRESFRSQKKNFGIDVVIVAHASLNSLNKVEIRSFIDMQWLALK